MKNNKFYSIFAVLAVVAAIAMVCIPSPAKADPFSYGNQAAVTQIFSNFSTSSGTATASSTVDVSKWRYKTVTVQGVAVAAHANAALSGTVAVLCAPTCNGPFVAATGLWTTAAGVALSTTSNTTMDWQGACQCLELTWAKTAGEVNAWLSVGN